MPPPEKPLPKPPKPKPPKPKPKKLKTGPAAADAKPMPERDVSPINGGVPSLPHPFSATSCSTFPLCPPPPAPPATVHLRSARLPTPLIAVSASLLALSAVLLLALLVRWLVRRRRRLGQQQQHAQQDQEAPLAPDDGDDESVLGVDTTAWGVEEEGEEVDSGDVHHVWFIRTKGLDERAIAAIAAVVYDASSKGKSCGGGAGEDGDGCAVCLAEFRDGETLRLLPRCGHAFHRGCIDTWLRAHVNCPLCRAPVQVHVTAGDKAGTTAAWIHSQAVAHAANHRGAPTEADEAERVVAAERAVRRAASMVTIPRRAWLDVAVQVPPASSSAREEDMMGLAKIRRLLKLSDALAGVGRSMSFGAGTCQRLPTTRLSGPPSTAAPGRVDGGGEIESSL